MRVYSLHIETFIASFIKNLRETLQHVAKEKMCISLNVTVSLTLLVMVRIEWDSIP